MSAVIDTEIESAVYLMVSQGCMRNKMLRAYLFGYCGKTR